MGNKQNLSHKRLAHYNDTRKVFMYYFYTITPFDKAKENTSKCNGTLAALPSSNCLIDLSTAFETFVMAKLGKIRRNQPLESAPWNELTCQVWKWYLLSERRRSSVKLSKFIDVCMGGGGQMCAP